MNAIGDMRLAGASDFDFLLGSWKVEHRKLRDRLAGSSDWFSFTGTMHADPILGGLGNFDQNVIDAPEGAYQACTLRMFHPETRLWSLHWIDGRDPKIDAPLFGSFANDVGTFFGDDLFRERPIKLRFHWSQEGPAKARWDQAFSPDDGKSWEVNWMMEFTRA